MFTVESRDAVRQQLLDRAAADPAVVGAAVTGSHVVGAGDRWSDIDLALAVDGPLDATIRAWTDAIYRDHDAVHHWDLPSGSAVYRVFLLSTGLEVDLAFTPTADFGPRGPRWQTVFGTEGRPAPFPATDPGHVTGLAWHHALHAWTSIQRGRRWQAEQWIAAVRGHVLTLASLRLGHPASNARGAHLLPDDVTAPLEATLVRSLDGADLHRALTAAVDALVAEVARADPALADRLRPVLAAVQMS
ncbi:hypothetical protein [Virgisporangium ochraceum]|uniref:Nucleotidyltransferase domain-containing protein n=1 Tax=Virgisporangium ochraceum TaxID=65505 RepID=A0A8J4A591_9ACTN|nr:hypothetical protein [Virgisporangium ochraceum]GIJ73625.1 hypothetical protein Voc01_085420 [Virgisporangium ochraceum]